MGKPRVQVRVDESTKRDLTEYADEEELTEADATRRVLSKGLEAERGELAITDGGVQQVLEHQQRQQRSQQLQGVGLMLAIVYLTLFIGGQLPFVAAAGFGAIITAVLGYSTLVARGVAPDVDEVLQE